MDNELIQKLNINRSIVVPNKISGEYTSIDELIDGVLKMINFEYTSNVRSFLRIDIIEFHKDMDIYGKIVDYITKENNPGILPIHVEHDSLYTKKLIHDIIKGTFIKLDWDCETIAFYTPQIVTVCEKYSTTTKLIIQCSYGGLHDRNTE